MNLPFLSDFTTFPQSQLQSFQSHISPQHYKCHSPLLPIYIERLCLQTKPQPLLEAFGSKEARYPSLFVYYYFLMFETFTFSFLLTFYHNILSYEDNHSSFLKSSTILSTFVPENVGNKDLMNIRRQPTEKNSKQQFYLARRQEQPIIKHCGHQRS